MFAFLVVGTLRRQLFYPIHQPCVCFAGGWGGGVHLWPSFDRFSFASVNYLSRLPKGKPRPRREAWFTWLPILIHWSGLVFSTGTLVKKQDLFFLYSIKNVYELMEALHNFHHHQGNLVKYPSEDYTPSITSGLWCDI